MSRTDEPTVKIIHRENRLKKKVGGAGAKIGAVAPERIEEAERVLERMSEAYITQAEADLEQLSRLHVTAEISQEERRIDTLRQLALKANDMHGQGQTFGYPLISRFAKQLRDFADGVDGSHGEQLAVIRAHIDALRIIIAGRIQDEGGTTDRELSKMLAIAIKRYG